MNPYISRQAYKIFSLLLREKNTHVQNVLNNYLIKHNSDFWCWFLGSISYLKTNDVATARTYFEQAKELQKNNTYLIILEAYFYLYDDNLSKAIALWVNLESSIEKKFIRGLLEEARQDIPLIQFAKEGNLNKLLVIPNIKTLYTRQRSLKKLVISKRKINSKNSQKKKNIYRIILRLLLIGLISIGLLLLIFISFLYIKNTINNSLLVRDYNEGLSSFDQLDLNSIYLQRSTKKQFIYEYNTIQNIQKDFNKAKELLKDKKVNQARYLLNKIQYSNADFVTKEKAKYFLEFIPELDLSEFQDSISIDKIIQNFHLYKNSQVLWEVVIIKERTVSNGNLFSIIKEHKNKTYKIEAFLKTDSELKPWLSLEHFQKWWFNNKKLNTEKAIIFGTVRSLIHKDILYIELDKIWN